MKRFLGLGAALMAGVVIASDKTYDFQGENLLKAKNLLTKIESGKDSNEYKRD